METKEIIGALRVCGFHLPCHNCPLWNDGHPDERCYDNLRILAARRLEELQWEDDHG